MECHCGEPVSFLLRPVRQVEDALKISWISMHPSLDAPVAKKIYSFFNSSKGSCMKNSTYFSHLYAERVQYCIQFLFRAPVNFLHLLLLVIIICYNLLLYIYLYYHVKNYKIVGTIIANLIVDKGWRLGFGARKYIGNVFYADETLRTSVP